MRLGSAVRISLNLGETPIARGHPAPFTGLYKRLEGGQPHAVVCAPVHSMTHRDFPLNKRDGLRIASTSPVEMSAIILDFRAKKRVLSHHLLAAGESAELPEITGPEPIPFLNLASMSGAQDLVALIRDLAITKEEIRNALEDAGVRDRLSSHMLVFRTDWLREFHRHRVSYGNPFLEGHSAYLSHPYLSPGAAEWLRELGLRAIAHDLPSFENPLLYAKGPNVIPIVQNARILMDEFLAQEGHTIEERCFESEFNSVRNEREAPPTYVKLLSFKDTGGFTGSDFGSPRREISVIPIPALQDPYGIACEVYIGGTED